MVKFLIQVHEKYKVINNPISHFLLGSIIKLIDSEKRIKVYKFYISKVHWGTFYHPNSASISQFQKKIFRNFRTK